MSFTPRNLLVTGGAGFIGANFVRHWLARAESGRVVVLDALTYAGNRENLAGLSGDRRYRFVQGDICDNAMVSALMDQDDIDTIVHFAAESHVDRSILGPDDFIRTNVVGTHALLKAAKARWLDRGAVRAHRFHHVSTDEVYGSLGPRDPAFSERTAYAPNSPYSASKAASDHLVRAYHETFGLDTTVTNCSNNYGPYQFPEKLIPLVIVNVLLARPLPVYGDGLQVRDWLHVSDHCQGIELALTRGVAGSVYNLGGGAETTNLRLVNLICHYMDETLSRSNRLRDEFPASPACRGAHGASLIEHVRDRPGHDRRYAIDFSRARKELGYTPSRDLASGLRETIDWYLANTGWWQRLLGRDFSTWLNANYLDRTAAFE